MPPKGTAVKVKKKRNFNPVAYLTSHARKAWQWSPVRKAALLDYCEECGARAEDGAKLHVHHRIPADVYKMCKAVIEKLIPKNTDHLDCLCTECHKEADRRNKTC